MHEKRFSFSIGIFFLVSFLFFLPLSIQAAEYYVNGTIGNDTSGDGSDQNPWKTISYGSSQVSAGDTLCLQSGAYNEYVNLNSNGLQVVPITYNVSVSGNRVTFPSGTDLSNVQTNGQDYVYMFRSKVSNNGIFSIVGKGGTYVQIENQLIEEQGSPGDEMKLSAAIGRPVLITNCSQKPGDEPVITGSASGFYMEKNDFNILDGITIRNSLQSFNMQHGGNYNVIQNCTVDTITDMNGIQIGQSTASYPNTYNIIANNTIYNPMVEGIYIGAGGQGETQNHTDFTHIIDNEVYTSGGVKELENAIDLKEYNKGSVVEGNYIHDIVLMTGGNAIIDVRDNHTDVWIYNNVFTNIQTDVLYRSVFMTHSTERLEIFNNILYNPMLDPVNETFTWMSKGGSGSSVDFYNNTIHNLARGFWMENSGGTYRMHNNIFSGVEGDYLRQWNDSGNLILKNNVFTADPNWTPSNNALETGRIVSSNIRFYDTGSGNFSIQEGSVAIDAGTTDLYAPRDRLLRSRSLPPDIGAYEESAHTPTLIPTPSISQNPVYRFWSDEKQGHFYTISEEEKQYVIDTYDDFVWRYEGIAYYAYPSSITGTNAVYRFWSDEKQGHFYTASAEEKDHVINTYDDFVWRYEGIAYYVYPLTKTDSVKTVYRFWSDQKQNHFYTASAEERDYVINTYDDFIWRYEGTAWNVPQ